MRLHTGNALFCFVLFYFVDVRFVCLFVVVVVPAKRNALKAKTDSSLATSAGTFIAAPKHWPARGWQSKELQDQGRLTMAWVPIMGGLTVFSVYFYHTEEWTERNQQILEAAS